MKTVQVSERAANMIEELRNEPELHVKKSLLCDVFCNIVADADEIGADKETFMPLLVALTEYSELLTELSLESDINKV